MKSLILLSSFSPYDLTQVEYLKCLISLECPDGFRTSYTHVTRAPIHLARQAAAETAMAQGAEWLVMFDDDMVFPPDTVKRLLAHGQDMVCSLAYGRKPPGYGIRVFSSDPADPQGVRGVPMEGIEHTGLRQVDISGFAVSLTRVSVFHYLRKVGVERFFGNFTEGGEDFYFSKVLRDAGIPLHVDTDLIVGHLGDRVVVDETFKKGRSSGI